MPDEMWAYVDESGCMGMKIGAGSSPFFTVIATIFSDRKTVASCYSRIEELKATLRAGAEFKFSKCSHEKRVGFFKNICQFDFNYFGINFDKAQIGGFTRPFLHLAVLTAFAQHADNIEHVKVTIDKTGSSEFRKMMAKRLKADLNRQFERDVIARVKSTESDGDNLLQLADMVCGAVARSYDPDKKGKHTYREMLRAKEWRIAEYP